MKAGTAQKLVLNMISTTVMVQLGHVRGNKMVDMMLSNDKLKDRAVKMVMSETGIARTLAETLIKQYGNVRAAITHHEASNA